MLPHCSVRRKKKRIRTGMGWGGEGEGRIDFINQFFQIFMNVI